MDYSRLPIALVIVAAMFFVVFLMPTPHGFKRFCRAYYRSMLDRFGTKANWAVIVAPWPLLYGLLTGNESIAFVGGLIVCLGFAVLCADAFRFWRK